MMASSTSAVSSGSPKVRIQFGATAPLRCAPLQLPGIWLRADSGMMLAPNGGILRAQPVSKRVLATASNRLECTALIRFILVVAAEERGEVFENEPVELRLHADDHFAENVDRLAVLSVDRSLAAGACGEKDIFVTPIDEEADRDTRFGRRHRRYIRQVTVDWHLALRRGPENGIDLALDDATRVHLDEDFRFIARFHVAQFVLPEEGKQPGIVLLDEAHHGHGRELRRAHAGLQGEIGYAAVGGRAVDAPFEIKPRIDEVGLGFGDLGPGLRFR